MVFMSLWRPAKNANPPTEKLMAEMNALIDEMTKAGVLLKTGGWDPTSPCTLLKSSNGQVTVTDGPYAESKELIAGFAIFEVKSKQEAIVWGTRFLNVAGAGLCEMRPLGP
jgi:hypothetical protein